MRIESRRVVLDNKDVDGMRNVESARNPPFVYGNERQKA